MEWIKAILEQLKADDDGSINVDAALKQINAEFPKHAVPKEDYNAKSAELKTASKTIAELKASTMDNEALQSKISAYETTVSDLQKNLDGQKMDYAIELALMKAGARNIKTVSPLLERDKLKLDGDGITGLDDQIEAIKKADDTAFLFESDKSGGHYEPKGGKPPAANPFSKDTYNMTKQAELFKASPEQAREMAAAAGVEI